MCTIIDLNSKSKRILPNFVTRNSFWFAAVVPFARIHEIRFSVHFSTFTILFYFSIAYYTRFAFFSTKTRHSKESPARCPISLARNDDVGGKHA